MAEPAVLRRLIYPIAKHWQRLSQRGAANLGYAASRRVVLVNQFCIIAIVLNLVYGLQAIMLDARGLGIFIGLVACACLAFAVVLQLNCAGHYKAARWILSSIPVATLFISSYLIGSGAGLQLYLLVIWTLLFLIFTKEELATLIVFSAIYWLGFLLIEYRFTEPALAYSFPPGVIERIHGLSITGTFLSVALIVGLFFNEIHRAEQRLQMEFERSEKLLRNILPAPIADQLKSRRLDAQTDGTAPIADGYPLVSVLFADLVGFTPLSERLSPDAVVGLLNTIFSQFDTLVSQHGLEKIKTIGDAYMLVGGLPEPRQNHLHAVACAALQMQALMPEFSRLSHSPLQLRIGIHCGPLVAGVIGQHKFAYDVWGDTVNLASRLESHGMPGCIQVSSEVHQQLKGQFAFEPRGRIDIKGKGQLQTWLLLGRSA